MSKQKEIQEAYDKIKEILFSGFTIGEIQSLMEQLSREIGAIIIKTPEGKKEETKK